LTETFVVELENLSSHVDMHTRLTLTFDHAEPAGRE